MTAFLAVIAVLAFALLAGIAMYKTITAPNGKPPHVEENFAYLTAALSALVGGVVAASFGLAPKPELSQGPGAQSSPGADTSELLTANLEALSSVVTGKRRTDVGSFVGGAYVVVYVFVGLAAIVIWVVLPNQTADPVKALAATALGMIVPVVRGFWTQAESNLSP